MIVIAKSYEQIKEKYRLKDNVFPLDEKGVNLFAKVYRWTVSLLAGLVMWGLMRLIGIFIVPPGWDKIKGDPKFKFTPPKDEPSLFSGDGFMYHLQKMTMVRDGVLLKDPMDIGVHNIGVFVSLLGTIGRWFSILALVFAAIYWMRYLVVLVKRQRLYERNVLRNDYTAVRLRSYIINELDTRQLKSELDRSVSEKEKSETAEESQKRKMYETMLRVKVLINTRETVDSGKIVTLYRIMYELPGNTYVREKLESATKNVGSTGTAFFENEVTFGERLESENKRFFMFLAVRDEVDPYKYEIDEDDIDLTEYESSYSTTVFKDYREEAAMKRRESQKWANDSGNSILMMLTNLNVLCNLTDTNVSNTTILYTFALSPGSKFPNTEGITKTLNQTFKVTDVDCKMEGNDLKVLIPLPSRYRVAIDVASMYREVFGSAD